MVVVSLGTLATTFFVLRAGNYTGTAWRWRPVATYLSCAELCEAAYKRSVLPVWPLAKH